MLESIHIQGSKGFTDTIIGPLRKVNLIVGGQNVGKTSLLEAVYMTLVHSDEAPFRQKEGSDSARLALSGMGKDFKWIQVQSFDGAVNRMQKGDQPVPQGVSFSSSGGRAGCAWFLSGVQPNRPIALPLYLPRQVELVELFGKIVLTRKKRELTKLLQQIEPRLISLDAISPDGEQRIYAELEGVQQALSLPEMGHGFGRLLYLFCTLLSTESNLALIDEVESGVHYSALPTLLQGIKNVAQERDVQTLMTTHSWDCIRAACEVFADSPEDFQVIRLERTKDNIRAVCIDGERMQRLMADDREVR